MMGSVSVSAMPANLPDYWLTASKHFYINILQAKNEDSLDYRHHGTGRIVPVGVSVGKGI